VEVVTGSPRRRRWGAAEKAAIVAESLAPGAQTSEIALRHGLHRNQLYGWRRECRLAAVADTGTPGPDFVPVVSESHAGSARPVKHHGRASGNSRHACRRASPGDLQDGRRRRSRTAEAHRAHPAGSRDPLPTRIVSKTGHPEYPSTGMCGSSALVHGAGNFPSRVRPADRERGVPECVWLIRNGSRARGADHDMVDVGCCRRLGHWLGWIGLLLLGYSAQTTKPAAVDGETRTGTLWDLIRAPAVAGKAGRQHSLGGVVSFALDELNCRISLQHLTEWREAIGPFFLGT
jgi:transposase-like protein